MFNIFEKFRETKQRAMNNEHSVNEQRIKMSHSNDYAMLKLFPLKTDKNNRNSSCWCVYAGERIYRTECNLKIVKCFRANPISRLLCMRVCVWHMSFVTPTYIQYTYIWVFIAVIIAQK